MFVYGMSGRICVNLGGTAEVFKTFVPVFAGAKVFFVVSDPFFLP